jgi:hypothetical protein
MPEKTSGAASQSPVVPARRVAELTRLLLFVRAGGQCEFDDCKTYLLEHHVTLTEGVFGEMAHVVAFKPDGPRGKDARPANINDISNLMVLCPRCHKLIDDHPEQYTRATLEHFKAAHETHIRQVTSLSPGHRTAVLTVRATIGDQVVLIPLAHIFEAVAPRYPLTRQGAVVDLTVLGPEGEPTQEAGCAAIRNKIQWLTQSPDSDLAQTGHLSLFALGPIPLLVYLGSQLSNKVPLEVYQRHRDTETWTWKADGPAVRYRTHRLRQGTDKQRVAVIMSLSGQIGVERLAPGIDDRFSIYELTLEGISPSPVFLRRREDLAEFRLAYQRLFSELEAGHGALEEIHLFPAVPAPVAVLCGRERLPKVHPALMVYDSDKGRGGFGFRLRIE